MAIDATAKAAKTAVMIAAAPVITLALRRRPSEIDFVCGPRDAIEAVEVADWGRLNRQKATAPARALPGRPSLVATRDELEFGRSSNLVPAALLLWALG